MLHIVLSLSSLLAGIALAEAHPPYAGNLTHVLCDVKTALNSSELDGGNAPTLIAALISSMGCDGLRIPILPTYRKASEYPSGYAAAIAAARSAGLLLYASPMENSWEIVSSTFSNSSSPSSTAENSSRVSAHVDVYIDWLADYIRTFAPLNFVSPFNEVGSSNCDPSCMTTVGKNVRGAVGAQPGLLYVGPDDEHVDSSIGTIKAGADRFRGVFDILSSHNAGGDTSSTRSNWDQMIALAGGRPVWSSENPNCFTLPACTHYASMSTPVDAGVQAIVPWATLGDDVSISDGSVTQQGSDIAKGLLGA